MPQKKKVWDILTAHFNNSAVVLSVEVWSVQHMWVFSNITFIFFASLDCFGWCAVRWWCQLPPDQPKDTKIQTQKPVYSTEVRTLTLKRQHLDQIQTETVTDNNVHWFSDWKKVVSLLNQPLEYKINKDLVLKYDFRYSKSPQVQVLIVYKNQKHNYTPDQANIQHFSHLMIF